VSAGELAAADRKRLEGELTLSLGVALACASLGDVDGCVVPMVRASQVLTQLAGPDAVVAELRPLWRSSFAEMSTEALEDFIGVLQRLLETRSL